MIRLGGSMTGSDAAGSIGRGQRFYMTLLFSDLCDYTALTEASDPEDIVWLKQEIAKAAKQVIGERGGSINQFYGDGVLAVFGYPVPDEDDARRGIEAAIALHEAIRTLRVDVSLPAAFQLRMHSGVHSGVVFVREGDPLHGRYELTGDAVNTTQRLCSAARPDEIVVSRAALSGIEPYFETEEIAPLSLKGKERPMLASRVVGRSDVHARFEVQNRRGLTPFVGREPSLEQLQLAMAAAVERGGRVICVTGPAGIGKSRLLDAFRRRLPPTTAVFVGSCERFANVAPLRPFAQVLRQSFLGGDDLPVDRSVERLRDGLGAIDGSLVQHLRAFLHLLSLERLADAGGEAPAPSPKSAKPDVALALSALFRSVAARQPVVILLDDWQWADDASKQALGVLLRAMTRAPVLVVLGSRGIEPDDVLLLDAPRLALDPFTHEESTRAIRTLLPRSLDIGVSGAIHRRSGGNPLFLEEVCRALPIDSASEHLAASIPTTVHGLIQARVARLPSDEAEVLRAAAVIGNDVPYWLLEKASARADVRSVLQRLIDHELIVAGQTEGSLSFQHGITREVVYESVPMRSRKTLHGEVALAIEERSGQNLAEHYEALAHHYARSASPARAIDYAELAGDKALASTALDRVRMQYGAALAALDAQPPSEAGRKRWLNISGKWALGCLYSPARSQLTLLGRAAQYAGEVGDQEAIANTQYWMGWIHYALGEQDAAIQYYTEALARATEGRRSNLRAQVLVSLGQSYSAAGEYPKALAYLAEGIDLLRARAERTPQRGPASGFAYALGCRALVHGDRGDFRLAYDDMDEALAMVGEAHAIHGSLLGLLGMIQLWQGEWKACLATVQRSREKAEQVNGPYVLAMSQTVGGYARWVLEGSPDALEQLRRSVEWLDSREIRLFLSFNYAHLADALVSAGQLTQAREFALRALARAGQKDPIGEATAHRALARQAALDPSAELDAEAHIGRALASAEARGSRRDAAVTSLLIGERLVAAGDRPAAEAVLQKAKASFEAMGMPWHRARAESLLGAR
jgi:class 3 adenylate cyclase/tetratricopeptide (TPR) repeat protein